MDGQAAKGRGWVVGIFVCLFFVCVVIAFVCVCVCVCVCVVIVISRMYLFFTYEAYLS